MAPEGFKLPSLCCAGLWWGLHEKLEPDLSNKPNQGWWAAGNSSSTSQPQMSPRNADERPISAWGGTHIMKLDTRLPPAKRAPVWDAGKAQL